MRELQQVTTTVPDAAKRCRFYRVELLNGASIGRGEKRCQIDGNRAKAGDFRLFAARDVSHLRRISYIL